MNTTNSQAASIASKDFLYMLSDYDRGDVTQQALIGYIDAKLRNAISMGYLKASEDHKELLDGYEARTEKAESRLAEIQRGVEGLLQYIADHDWGGIPEPVPQIDALRALLQPQGQADTSGLPG